jgi:hypothetical protein
MEHLEMTDFSSAHWLCNGLPSVVWTKGNGINIVQGHMQRTLEDFT